MGDNIDSNKRIAKNTLFLYLRMAIVLVVSLYTTRVVLHSLGVENFGIYNVVCGFVSLFGFLNSTLSSSINRFYNYELGCENNAKIDAVYTNSIIIQGTLALIILLVVEVLGIWYLNTYMVLPEKKMCTANWIFQFSIISMIFTILQTPYIAAVLAYERMNFYAVVSIVDVILKLLIAISVYYHNSDRLWLYGFLIMLISVINFLMYLIYSLVRFKSLRISHDVDKHLLKSMISFSAWSFLNPLAYTGRSQGCNIVLNYFFGPVVNAAYAITNQVSSAIDSFSMSISVAARPQLIQTYSNGNYDRSIKLFNTSSKIMFMLVCLLVMPLFANMEFILNLWLSNDIPSVTTSLCVLILFVKLIDSLNPSCTNIILASGKIKTYMIVSSVITFAVVPLSIFGFLFMDDPSILFVIMILCTIVNQLASVIIVSEIFNRVTVIKYIRTIFMPGLFIVVLDCTVMTLMFNAVSIENLISSTFVSSFLIIALSWFILLDVQERNFIIKTIKIKKG